MYTILIVTSLGAIVVGIALPILVKDNGLESGFGYAFILVGLLLGIVTAGTQRFLLFCMMLAFIAGAMGVTWLNLTKDKRHEEVPKPISTNDRG